MGIIVKCLEIKIRIRGHEIKHIVLGLTEPVFPTFVPSFHKHLVKAMLGSKINVSSHLLVVGSVTTVRLCL